MTKAPLYALALVLLATGSARGQRVVYDFGCDGIHTCTVERHELYRDHEADAMAMQGMKAIDDQRFNERMDKLRKEGEAFCKRTTTAYEKPDSCLQELTNLRAYDEMTGEHPVLKGAPSYK